MTYTIPPDSPKAVQAAEFGRELVKACRARSVPLKELERAAGVGHTCLDNYRRGLILPRTETAYVLAAALDWPQLRVLVDRFRTATCGRSGCERRFRNDGGSRKRYCSYECQQIARARRQASQRARRAGQTGDGRSRAAQIARLHSAVKIADEKVAVLSSAIGAMCLECEPEAICRQAECPLRPFSPLPLELHAGTGQPRTIATIRSGSWSPERRATFRAHLEERWSDPLERIAQGDRARSWFSSLSPEEREAWKAKQRASRSLSDRSQAAKRGWATRRAKAQGAA